MQIISSKAKTEFLFGAIVPVYNKADYLEEALESLLHQTIGFTENVQVVLINDGSTDASPSICEKYAEMHPENIIYIDQENAGVSAARNAGLRAVSAKYITFFDADDVWDLDAFEKAASFFLNHEKETDVLAARIVQFGDVTSPHVLDYKYEETCVADFRIKPDFVQPMIGNCFFASTALENRLFREDLSYAEDTLFVNDILLDKLTCGILADACYHYRKIKVANTASMRANKARYENNNKVYQTLYELSKSRLGSIPAFIKQLALYEMCWQVLMKCEDDYSTEEAESWHSQVSSILKPVDNSMICAARWLTINKKLALLELKNNKGFLRSLVWNSEGFCFFDGNQLLSIQDCNALVINRLRVEEGFLALEGMTRVTFFDKEAVLFVQTDQGSTIPLDLTPFPSHNVATITGENLLNASRFSAKLPLFGTSNSFQFFWKCREGGPVVLPIGFTLYGGLPSKYSYFAQNGIIVKRTKKVILKTMKDRFRTHAASEFRECRFIATRHNFTLKRRAGLIGLRLCANLLRTVKKKPVWVFVDREYKAGDSAESLFTLARKNPKLKNVDMFFLLEKTSPDYPRLKSLGKVLEPKSFLFYLRFLTADKLFSGHHDGLVTNPFEKKASYLADLFQYDFYNLSHGTLQGDLSKQLNRHVLPIHRFFVSTKMEYEALTKNEYGFSEDEVCLSGMCRYDAYDKALTTKKVIFLPTWRASLAGKIIPGTRVREFVEDFEESDYCKAYNSLINDESLLEAMREAGYVGEFYVHPNYEKQTSCFHGNDVITVSSSSADYTRVLSEGALLITDYSGISFDFAYMRKPLLYYQFDNLFNGKHSYQDSYFDYEIQGFGPVCHTQNELVSQIAQFLKNNCRMSEDHMKRANEFFYYDDQKNSQRVLNAILRESDTE